MQQLIRKYFHGTAVHVSAHIILEYIYKNVLWVKKILKRPECFSLSDGGEESCACFGWKINHPAVNTVWHPFKFSELSRITDICNKKRTACAKFRHFLSIYWPIDHKLRVIFTHLQKTWKYKKAVIHIHTSACVGIYIFTSFRCGHQSIKSEHDHVSKLVLKTQNGLAASEGGIVPLHFQNFLLMAIWCRLKGFHLTFHYFFGILWPTFLHPKI